MPLVTYKVKTERSAYFNWNIETFFDILRQKSLAPT